MGVRTVGGRDRARRAGRLLSRVGYKANRASGRRRSSFSTRCDPSPSCPKVLAPDGTTVRLPPARIRASVRRVVLAPCNPWFARTWPTAVSGSWLRGIDPRPDDFRPTTAGIPTSRAPVAPARLAPATTCMRLPLDILTQRRISFSSIPRSDHAEARPVRLLSVRLLDAEVSLTRSAQLPGTTRSTERDPRAVHDHPYPPAVDCLADGSVTSSFLEIFGSVRRATRAGLRSARISPPRRSGCIY
jgi:hypothetical protein